ncbi:peptidoglycan-binding domain-containing protein [Motiliproteus sediminis]|uniref:peptidoglycan-binding domain-containing protein n=1 Tax=Motiliproteus sediminis TaxID=1468178 RepID=UPI001AEF71E6|nr:peptidoglycan-binding domain-containing protein [Motiliproteus sediminis]
MGRASHGRRARFVRRLLAPLMLLLISSPTWGADANQRFAMKGAGLLNCFVYTGERQKRSDVYFMIGGWIEGYLSAYNQFVPRVFDITSFESLELLLSVVDNHCRQHPEDKLHAVLQGVLRQLQPDAITEESARVEIEQGERRTRLYRTTVTRMQQKLTALGLYQGPSDGRYTDAVRAALIAFQTDLGFEPSGFPDQATLWRLLRPDD